MAKLHFTDIVAMAKSGWTPDAVNSMLDRFEAINAKDEADESDPEDENKPDKSNKNSSADDHEEADDNSNDSSNEDEKDKEIASLKAQVEQLQKDNSHQNNDSGEKKTLDDLVDDIFREFYD